MKKKKNKWIDNWDSMYAFWNMDLLEQCTIWIINS